MTVARFICEEFCEEVATLPYVVENGEQTLDEVWEIKCRLKINYFTPLVERMVQIGYCCTQVQKDLKTELCTAWFQPQSLDEGSCDVVQQQVL